MTETPLPTPMVDALAALRARPIPPTEKGFGAWPAGEPASAAGLADTRPALREAGFSYPLMTLHEPALRHNVTGMADYCAAAGVLLAPHGKTTMAPQLAAAQLGAGAWAITVATLGQLRAYREFGVPRLLLANELVDEAGIGWLAGELAADPDFEAYCYVDSLAGVAVLDAALSRRPAGRKLPVLVEYGHANGRTGARTIAEAVAVAEAAATTSTLRLAGVAGYEGGLGHDASPASLTAVTEYCRALHGLFNTLQDKGILAEQAILSAGGSLYFDIVVRELTAPCPTGARPRVVLRSGAYVTHDHGVYHRVSPAERHLAGPLSLRPALELWAQVVSRPEPELVLLTAGRRDVSFDEGLPVVLRACRRSGETTDVDGWQITALNDQHAYLRLPADAELAVGDLIGLGISHPCTAFDKWRLIPVVDAEDRVVDVVHTFF
ncbi:MAG TPA: alanine racemase [Pseudonocardiaceae bacterium]|jgi:D-serine deaminase-like pyridoxal phosphate-dependent protein|nr:alanine racemase [Pseudonocardiaceae bacterium]